MPSVPPPAPDVQEDPLTCCEGAWQHAADCDVAPLDQIGGA